MPSFDGALRLLLNASEYAALTMLWGEGPSTGRHLAFSLGISPVTVNKALFKLLAVGFVGMEVEGRAYIWHLNEEDPWIADWIQEGWE